MPYCTNSISKTTFFRNTICEQCVATALTEQNNNCPSGATALTEQNKKRPLEATALTEQNNNCPSGATALTEHKKRPSVAIALIEQNNPSKLIKRQSDNDEYNNCQNLQIKRQFSIGFNSYLRKSVCHGCNNNECDCS